MGSLSDRVKRLERGNPDYPERIVAEAMQRLSREALEYCIAKMESVIDGGAPEKEAKDAIDRIARVCLKVQEENRRREYRTS